ncbi:MAG: hypothetical protein Devi2KO_37710 [Devosia indica]
MIILKMLRGLKKKLKNRGGLAEREDKRKFLATAVTPKKKKKERKKEEEKKKKKYKYFKNKG